MSTFFGSRILFGVVVIDSGGAPGGCAGFGVKISKIELVFDKISLFWSSTILRRSCIVPKNRIKGCHDAWQKKDLLHDEDNLIKIWPFSWTSPWLNSLKFDYFSV